MTTQNFLQLLLICSVLTSLVTEAVKKILSDYKKIVHANTLVAIISCVLAIAIGISYAVVCSVNVTAQYVIYVVALTFLSWLCAMVGYDKVMESFSNRK